MTRSTHTASRTILASPRAIFRALLDPEVLVKWRPPAGMSARLRAFDPRAGGGYCIEMRYGDASRVGKTTRSSDIVWVRFETIDPDDSIVERIRFDSEDPAFAGEMRLTTSLRAVADGTQVTFIAEHVPAGIDEADHRTGMESSLKNLANLLE